MAYKFDALTLIPGYGLYRMAKNAVDNVKTNGYKFGDISKGWWGFREEEENPDMDAQTILGEVGAQSRQEYLEDRAHTEEREDTAYQRAVADMKKAGLSPYTVGASSAPSSASTVGEHSIGAKLQMLGYILDLKNLDIKNRQVTNQAIGNVLKAIKVSS